MKEYLSRSEFDILIDVLRTQAFVKEVESIKAVNESRDGAFEGYTEKSKVLLAEARDCNRTIDLLIALRDQEEPYRTATATPTDYDHANRD